LSVYKALRDDNWATETIPARSQKGEIFQQLLAPRFGDGIDMPADGIRAGGVLGMTDYEYLPATGPVDLMHENVEWLSPRQDSVIEA
jgi:hypothetical protein